MKKQFILLLIILIAFKSNSQNIGGGNEFIEPPIEKSIDTFKISKTINIANDYYEKNKLDSAYYHYNIALENATSINYKPQIAGASKIKRNKFIGPQASPDQLPPVEPGAMFWGSREKIIDAPMQQMKGNEWLAYLKRPYKNFNPIKVFGIYDPEENDFNLNIPRYVDTFEEEVEIGTVAVEEATDADLLAALVS